MAVEGDPLQVGEQILFGAGLRALFGNLTGQLVQFLTGLGDFLRRIDHVHGGLQGATTTCKVRHLHHDHAHVFRQENDIVAGVIPLGHLRVEGQLLASEQLHLLGDLLFILFGHFTHRLARRGDSADVRILVDGWIAGVCARWNFFCWVL